jgi:hypothetical protein
VGRFFLPLTTRDFAPALKIRLLNRFKVAKRR